jgi:glycosyltransferase involved in cell wall biosynthesis
MRIAIVYDCLFPHRVGGAERWYRNLALRLQAEGHEVTYVTMRQWGRDERPDLPGVHVVAVAPRMELYRKTGRRRIAPPLLFGLGVLWHLLVHGRRYDVVHTAAFPYFSLLAAAAARPIRRFGLVVDWLEFWGADYWRDYLGGLGGRIGWGVQALCLRVRQRPFCFAQVTARRLREAGVNGAVEVLAGGYSGMLTQRQPLPARPVAVFAGRHIPEKRVPAAVAAIAIARERLPQLHGRIFGDGPERGRVLEAIREHGLEDVVDAPGFVSHEVLDEALATALCLLHPTQREGYGLVVVESAALGVPSVLVSHPDNAATELIEEGVNGFVADGDDARALADAIVRVHEAGPELRASASAWFGRNARRMSIDASLDKVAAVYAAVARS